MPRPIRSFTERQVEAELREARQMITTTEHLLARILIELMQTRGRRSLGELAETLHGVGFSNAQAAVILDSTPATLHVVKGRRKPRPVKSDDTEPAPESR